ncbi:hypothetical protein CI109_103082 [Kwoniella shandongensis]|uniref:Uncharacterized protein n=1 Tax=Kwoniella shandongensis TaxID=1734106 RepID=A0A5M6CC77_9TREE|nr:uncharacterized protein CI109_000273 [Kwoniella shandongensis]KAA5531432.1 hypothetical protein CI109_000273 [Kwoniella shandongensis]
MRTVLLLSVLGIVAASSIERPKPTRQLEWKEVNFISTSDTHGWLLGHQHATWPEPNYSGDFGSFASFATHMRSIADSKGVDLLLVDAGDHHDGSGLVSSSPDGPGKTEQIFSNLPYDVMAVGNHELYHYADALELYENMERWNGRYVTSNVNITVKDGQRGWKSVPLGKQFVKFETKQGRSVTAFGVIFNFGAHDKGITIQKPSKLAIEEWFLDAIRNAPDYFVLAGHMPARGETAEWAPVFDAIRRVHPDVPIYVFGGHTHVRDCTQYDNRSIAVVPGRYLETVAFTSSSLPAKQDNGVPLDVARRYLDANPTTYKWHTNTSDETFHLPIGKNISLALAELATDLNVSTVLGIAPHDYFLNRHPYGHPRSVLTLFSDKVMPTTIKDKDRHGERIIISMGGSLRFDLFAGTFDRNDELTISPFVNAFYYARLSAGLARNITEQLNRAGASKLLPTVPSTKREEEQRVQATYDEWMRSQWEDYVESQGVVDIEFEGQQTVFSSATTVKKPSTLGYVTKDACPGKGDDIDHIPVPWSDAQPDFISTPFPEVDDDEDIDVVVMDFAMDDFLVAVNMLDPSLGLKESMMKPYAEGLGINVVFGMYAKEAWRQV